MARRIAGLVAEALLATSILGLAVLFGGVGALTTDALLHGQHAVMAVLWTPANFLIAGCCLVACWRLIHR